MAVVRWVVTFSLLSVAAGANAAATIHKSRGPDGRVPYQGYACDPGARTLERWDAPPDPVVAVAPRSSPASTRRRARMTSTSRRRISAPASSGSDTCAAAKERRDAIERRVGLARTYELLSALQRDVYEACK